MSQPADSADLIENYRLRLEGLETRLLEAEDTLEAIRSGDVDAVVVHGPNGQQVYTLENADRPYRVLIEKMQEGAVTLSNDGLVLYCNQAFAAMVKKPAERIIGSSFMQFVPPEEMAGFTQLLAQAGKGEILLQTGYGESIQTHLTLSELPDEDGRIICGVVTDISLHKLRMKELADKNQQLQKEISEREKTEESLRQAQKMEAVGQLTGGLAHDFNNLLTVILGNLQLISARSNDDRLEKYIKNAMSATERGAALTQKLLAFSRRQPLKSEVLRVTDFMPGIQMLARQVIGVNIELKLSVAENLWYCRTDINQLESAILNLVINARDAMPSGGRLSIEAANESLNAVDASRISDARPGNYVVVTVSDTGMGIPEKMIKRVLEPFFTTKDVGKGSGLGLSMVYGFVRQLNGFIDIQSSEAQGTRVRLFLPHAETPATDLRQFVSAQEGKLPTGIVILVVEDDEEVLTVLQELLSDIGYSVLTATNAKEALEIIQNSESRPQIDLVFSDVVMPGSMSGIDLARELRKRCPELPVLLTSGFISQSMDYNQELDSAEFQILRKPYSRTDLSDAIRQQLNCPETTTVH